MGLLNGPIPPGPKIGEPTKPAKFPA